MQVELVKQVEKLQVEININISERLKFCST